MVAAFARVLGTDVALVVETAVLDADAGHGDRGDIVHWFLHHLAQPMQRGLH